MSNTIYLDKYMNVKCVLPLTTKSFALPSKQKKTILALSI